MSDWKIFKGDGTKHNDIDQLGDPPNWRKLGKASTNEVERRFGMKRVLLHANEKEREFIVDTINAAIYLRRPLFLTGQPGCGKSSIAYLIAEELMLDKVIKWPITSRVTLSQGLYHYDAIDRLRDANLAKEAKEETDITKYLRLGPLGTALLPSERPRVLLIDEVDKSDIDFPNDLLNIFEEGEFNIPELARSIKHKEKANLLPCDSNDFVSIEFNGEPGKIKCSSFPIIVMTSNGEKDFPPAFLRRCLRINLQVPQIPEVLSQIVESHLGSQDTEKAKLLINYFSEESQTKILATDQLLNAIFLLTHGLDLLAADKEDLKKLLLRSLSND